MNFFFDLSSGFWEFSLPRNQNLVLSCKEINLISLELEKFEEFSRNANFAGFVKDKAKLFCANFNNLLVNFHLVMTYLWTSKAKFNSNLLKLIKFHLQSTNPQPYTSHIQMMDNNTSLTHFSSSLNITNSFSF